MPESIGALGDLVTGGLAADALTPPAGRKGHHPGGHCANCGNAVTARFCAHCGQPTHIHRSLLHVGEEFLHGITHFDGKAWQTLPMLVLRPGRLTRDYVYGKRARYVPPVALFLLTVFLMFFAFSYINVPATDLDLDVGKTRADRVAQAQKAHTAEAAVKAKLDEAEAKLAALSKDPGAAPGAAGQQSGAVAALEAAANLAGQVRERADTAIDHPEKVQGPLEVDWKENLKSLSTNPSLNVNMGGLTTEAKLRHALANPDLTLFKLQEKAYKFSWLLIPLSLPWLWLMFAWRRSVHMYDHAVFSLYSLSFMSLMFVTDVALIRLLDLEIGPVIGISLLVAALHIFVQMKGAYALRFWGAAWRTGFLLIGALLSLSLFLAAIILLGIAA